MIAGNRIRLSLSNIDVSNEHTYATLFRSVRCLNHLKVFDGPYASGLLKNEFCDSVAVADSIESKGSELAIRYLQLRSDQEGRRGFVAHYTTSKICSHTEFSFGKVQL